MTDSLLSLPSYATPQYQAGKLSGQTKTLLDNLDPQNENTKLNIDVKAAARKAADEFEAVFINNMIETMYSGLDTNTPFGGGQGERVFRSFLLNEYSKAIQSSGGFGISDQVYTQILALQENQNPTNKENIHQHNDLQKGDQS